MSVAARRWGVAAGVVTLVEGLAVLRSFMRTNGDFKILLVRKMLKKVDFHLNFLP